MGLSSLVGFRAPAPRFHILPAILRFCGFRVYPAGSGVGVVFVGTCMGSSSGRCWVRQRCEGVFFQVQHSV